MVRTKIVFGLLCVLLISIICVNLIYAADEQALGEVSIIYIKGAVNVQRDGEDAWIPAKENMLMNDKSTAE